MELLKKCLVDEIAKIKPNAIVFHSEQSVDEVLHMMHDNQITAAPVLELDTNKPLGFIDMLDLVWFVLDMVHDMPKSDAITSIAQKFGKEKVRKVINDSGRSDLHCVKFGTTLADVANTFKEGVHRIAVVDEQGAIKCIISQSDILAYFVLHNNEISGDWTKKVSDFPNLVHHKVRAVSKEAKVL